jgi:hypothetical protein
MIDEIMLLCVYVYIGGKHNILEFLARIGGVLKANEGSVYIVCEIHELNLCLRA